MSVEAIRNSEFLPNALINFVTNFGGGFHDHQRTSKSQLFSMKDLVEKVCNNATYNRIKPTLKEFGIFWFQTFFKEVC